MCWWDDTPNPINIYLIQIIFEFIVHFLSINETFAAAGSVHHRVSSTFSPIFVQLPSGKKDSFAHLKKKKKKKKSCWKKLLPMYGRRVRIRFYYIQQQLNEIKFHTIRNKLASGITLATAVEDLSFYTTTCWL